MRKNILITGLPKSGKSTLLESVVSKIPNKVGFLTREVKIDGARVGFEIESHTGNKSILAHIAHKAEHKVSRYFVDVNSLNAIIPTVKEFQIADTLYLDEIGEMQLFS